MARTVFILGAGASKEGGAPVMREFIDVARDLLARNRVGKAQAAFERVFSAIAALKAVHSNSRLEIDNIETLFAACEMAKTLGRFPGLKSVEDIVVVLTSLKQMIVTTLEMTLPFQLTNEGSAYLQAPTPYGKFADLILHLKTRCRPVHSVAILTFNYDIGCDFGLIVGRCLPEYALGHEAVSPRSCSTSKTPWIHRVGTRR